MCPFVWSLGEYWSTISVRRSGISRCVGWLKCRWVRLKRRWACTSHINLVGCYPVLLQLMQLNCVQQGSISSRVNSSTTTRGQHGYYSLRGDTAMPGGLYARLCHAFLVSFINCLFSSKLQRKMCIALCESLQHCQYVKAYINISISSGVDLRRRGLWAVEWRNVANNFIRCLHFHYMNVLQNKTTTFSAKKLRFPE